MRQRIRKRMVSLLLTGMMCVSMTGCGGEYESAGRAKKEDAVSGNAVSGAAVEKEKTQEKREPHRFATDTNVYYEGYESEKDEYESVYQVRRDGTHRKEILKNGEYVYLIGIADGWLYYETSLHSDAPYGKAIYRMAIGKDEKGYDVVRKDTKELLAETKNHSYTPLYVDSQYLFYIQRSGGRETVQKGLEPDKLIKYDLKKKKEVYRQEIFITGRAGDPVNIRRIGEQYLLFDAYGGSVAVQPVDVPPVDTQPWKKISDVSVFTEYLEQEGTNAYYVSCSGGAVPLNDMWVYDGEKETCILTEKQLRQVVSESIGIDEKTDELVICEIDDLFAENGRVYAQVEVGWSEKETYHIQYLVISRGKNETEFRRERGLTECMETYGQMRTGVWKITDEEKPDKILGEHAMCSNDAKCIGLVDGMAYVFCYDYREDKARLFCYEMQSGEVREITKSDALFYRLYLDENGDEYEELFEKNDYMNEYTGFTNCQSFCKDGEGEFYEK